MRTKIICGTLTALIIFCCAANAEVRTYRQIKDISSKENGKVTQSTKKGDLFEFSFNVDRNRNIVTRTKVQRLDESKAKQDNTVYNIIQKMDLLPSEAGNGGRALVAVRKDGGEILEMTHGFAFTTRVSPFSQVITGVYKRVYSEDRDRDYDRDQWVRKHKWK